MRGATHLVFGLILATLATEYLALEKPLLAVLLILLGSLLPDIDERTSLLGRKVPLIGHGFRHRGFFHGVLFLVACVIALSLLVEPVYLAVFAAAFALHLVLDALTPMGVAPFWPSALRLKGFVRVGGLFERGIFLAGAAVFVWLLLR